MLGTLLGWLKGGAGKIGTEILAKIVADPVTAALFASNMVSPELAMKIERQVTERADESNFDEAQNSLDSDEHNARIFAQRIDSFLAHLAAEDPSGKLLRNYIYNVGLGIPSLESRRRHLRMIAEAKDEKNPATGAVTKTANEVRFLIAKNRRFLDMEEAPLAKVWDKTRGLFVEARVPPGGTAPEDVVIPLEWLREGKKRFRAGFQKFDDALAAGQPNSNARLQAARARRKRSGLL